MYGLGDVRSGVNRLGGRNDRTERGCDRLVLRAFRSPLLLGGGI